MSSKPEVPDFHHHPPSDAPSISEPASSATSGREVVQVMIVDDDPLARQVLAGYLAAGPEMKLVGVHPDAAGLLDDLPRISVDVVVLDVRMPRMDGLAAAALVRERHPGVKVLFMTSFDDEDVLRAALTDGANGFLFKDTTPETFVQAIRAVQQGVHVLARLPQGVHSAEDEPLAEVMELRPRESEVLHLLCAGLSTQQIAQEMFLSVSSVKGYVSSLLAKLDASTRLQAVARAHALGLVDPARCS